MLEDDILCELLIDTVEPERQISFAVNLEMGHQNQQWISSSSNEVIAIQQCTRFAERIPVHNKSTEIISIAKQMVFAEMVDKTGHQHSVKFPRFGLEM